MPEPRDDDEPETLDDGDLSLGEHVPQPHASTPVTSKPRERTRPGRPPTAR